VDLNLTAHQAELKRRARLLTEEVMQYELPCEEGNGLPSETVRALHQRVKDHGLWAYNMPIEWGGLDFSYIDMAVITEEFGRLTNGLWWLMVPPANALRACVGSQRERYLFPAIRGEKFDAFAVTEPSAGSDPRGIEATAQRTSAGWVLNGEKWFVSAGDRADFLIVQAKVVPGDEHTLFLVDKDIPGLRLKRVPRYMQTFVFEHSEYVLTDCEVADDAVLGEVGGGFELSKAWFLGARLLIASQTLGAAMRAVETALDWARTRHTFGTRLFDNQMISKPLVDSVIEIAGARSFVYRVAWEADAGLDAKTLNALGAMAKINSTETAARVVDRCLQILGGRGYMRENPLERLYRDIRVERIWEGSSEIMRLVVANELDKRGLENVLRLPFAEAQRSSPPGTLDYVSR
jgi:acyl-CoA dehydrogenase